MFRIRLSIPLTLEKHVYWRLQQMFYGLLHCSVLILSTPHCSKSVHLALDCFVAQKHLPAARAALTWSGLYTILGAIRYLGFPSTVYRQLLSSANTEGQLPRFRSTKVVTGESKKPTIMEIVKNQQPLSSLRILEPAFNGLEYVDCGILTR